MDNSKKLSKFIEKCAELKSLSKSFARHGRLYAVIN